jgi:hypothetical protein
MNQSNQPLLRSRPRPEMPPLGETPAGATSPAPADGAKPE